MQKKKIIRSIFISLIFSIICFSPILQYGRADWTPSDTQLAPSKDTFVSIGGILSEPLSNFGGAETLYVGDGLYGYCVSAIEFDLSELPENLVTLQFESDIVVYGENTRTLEVYIMEGVGWAELEVTGLDNPFNATDICFTTGSVGNLTKITLTGSTSDITIDLGDYIDDNSLITLLFTTRALDESWFTMQSKENQYLASYSNPPRLEFTIEEAADDPSNAGTVGGGLFALAVIGVIIFVVIKKKKKKEVEMV